MSLGFVSTNKELAVIDFLLIMGKKWGKMLRNSIADVEERHGRLELTLNMKITDKVKWSVLFFMLDIITYYEFFFC